MHKIVINLKNLLENIPKLRKGDTNYTIKIAKKRLFC